MNPDSAFKETAWNHIRFKTPGDWEPCVIDQHHLMLEKNGGPVMEIRWGAVKKNFSPEYSLREMTKRHGKNLKESITKTRVPGIWKNVLYEKTTEITAFSWYGENQKAAGLILYNKASLNSVFIQFFVQNPAKPDGVTASVLKSLGYTADEKNVLWAMFDIRAILPTGFSMSRHSFAPGKYELVFSAKNHKIILHRWGPASVLLKNGNLVRFAEQQFQPAVIEHEKKFMDRYESAKWEIHKFESGKKFFFLKKLFSPAVHQGRIWHVEEKNRILGIISIEKKPPPDHLVRNICKNFKCT